MNNLQPLKWVDTTKGVDRVYCEKTDTYIDGAVLFCSTLVADYVIRKNKYNDGFTVNYGGRTEPEYNTLDEAKNWCEFTHYRDKMQPYVVPDFISINEKLPEQNTNVLVLYHAHFDDEEVTEFDICTAFFRNESFDVKDQNFYTRRKIKVVGWKAIDAAAAFKAMKKPPVKQGE